MVKTFWRVIKGNGSGIRQRRTDRRGHARSGEMISASGVQVAQTRELASVFVFVCISPVSSGCLGRDSFSNKSTPYCNWHWARPSSRSDVTITIGYQRLSLRVEKTFLHDGADSWSAMVCCRSRQRLTSGFLYNEEALEFRLERLDPISGTISFFFSISSVIEDLRQLIKIEHHSCDRILAFKRAILHVAGQWFISASVRSFCI